MHLRSGTNYNYLPIQNQYPSHLLVEDIDNEEEYYNNLENLFSQWKQIVNAIVLHNYGMGCEDIPDFPYYDCFVEHISPHEMFQIIHGNMFQS